MCVYIRARMCSHVQLRTVTCQRYTCCGYTCRGHECHRYRCQYDKNYAWYCAFILVCLHMTHRVTGSFQPSQCRKLCKTKNKYKPHDPEIHQIKKKKKISSTFVRKAHIDADAQSRRLHGTDELHQAWTGSPNHRMGKRRVKRYVYPGTFSD